MRRDLHGAVVAVASDARRVDAELELGAACIDMGGGSTGISIFMKKHMIYADSVRMGGDHVTSDISKGLQIPMAVPFAVIPVAAVIFVLHVLADIARTFERKPS